ncbi:dnaJ-like protein dnj-5 [Sesbania bispinosa]|nr:dnaJ-like protein dnj-5 [Sesbania bispinosa]
MNEDEETFDLWLQQALASGSLLRDLQTQEELKSIQIASKEREEAMAKNVVLKLKSVGKIHSSLPIPKGLME